MGSRPAATGGPLCLRLTTRPSSVLRATDRRRRSGRHCLRHDQMSRRLGWRQDCAGPGHHRGCDHRVAAASRIAFEIGPQEKCANRRDNGGDRRRNQFSTLVVGRHWSRSTKSRADVFAGIGFEAINERDAAPAWPCYPAWMRSAIWVGIFVGSTIGGFIPALWGGDMLSYSGVLLSGVGAFVGLWLGSRASR